MKNRKPFRLILLSLILPVILLIAIATIPISASSLIRLTANPQGDATACLHHPSTATCTEAVSPFGTEKPGASSCATQASIPALITISDPTMNEAPIATLQVWQSPTCHASFASASVSTLLGLQGPSTITVSMVWQRGWWQHTLRATTIHSNGANHVVRAWTPLLSADAS